MARLTSSATGAPVFSESFCNFSSCSGLRKSAVRVIVSAFFFTALIVPYVCLYVQCLILAVPSPIFLRFPYCCKWKIFPTVCKCFHSGGVDQEAFTLRVSLPLSRHFQIRYKPRYNDFVARHKHIQVRYPEETFGPGARTSPGVRHFGSNRGVRH